MPIPFSHPSVRIQMPRSDPMTHKLGMGHVVVLVLVLVGAAAISVAAAAHVDSFSYPAFDATADLVVSINHSALMPAACHLFDHDAAAAKLNHTQGFLLLSRTVDVWRAGPGGAPALEASFNTSFVLSGVKPVAFVVLLDPSSTTLGVKGCCLSVPFTPNGTATTVWIEYDATAHKLSEYLAGAGEARPAEAVLDMRISLAARRFAEKTMVGFFAGRIQDILVGVRGWNLTVDRLDDTSSSGGDGRKKKGTSSSWMLILLAVLGSVVATA